MNFKWGEMMKKVTYGYLKFTEYVNKISIFLVFLALAIMTLVIFWQVIARFLLGGAFAWGEELSRFLMIFMVIVGAAVALRTNSLISVDILLERATGKFKKTLIVVIHIATIVFCIVVIYYGTLLAQNFSIQKAPSLQVSMSYIYMFLPLGATLMILNSIACILEQFYPRKEIEE